MKNPVFSKVVVIGVLVLILLYGLSLIQGVVDDRQSHRRAAVASTGSSQRLMGPYLQSACTESWDFTVRSDKEVKTEEKQRQFTLVSVPESLTVTSKAGIDPRSRGLHAVNTFNLKSQINAKWANLDSLQPTQTVKGSRLSCAAPMVMLSISDAKGIRSVAMALNGQALAVKPGTLPLTYTRGVHASFPDPLARYNAPVNVDVQLELQGTESVSIVPLGETTQVRMQSDWPHPSFSGAFLPVERTVSPAGFEATWRVSALATGVGEGVAAGRRFCGSSPSVPSATVAGVDESSRCLVLDALAVGFIDPINAYTLSDRATKYGILFVVLTFVAVGLFEVMQRLRVHPVQYFLVGSAICSFFLLLVSLSEHLGFNPAYLIAAAACVLLLTYYASYMLGSIWHGLPFGLGIGLLYGLLFMLLQQEQTALAIGAVALFLVLAVVMALTRKVNWYGVLEAPTVVQDVAQGKAGTQDRAGKV